MGKKRKHSEIEETDDGPRNWNQKNKPSLPAINKDGSKAPAPYSAAGAEEVHIGKKKMKRLKTDEIRTQKKKMEKLDKQNKAKEKRKEDPTIPLVEACKRESFPQVRIILSKTVEKILSLPEKNLEPYFPAFFKIQDALDGVGSDCALLSAVGVISDLLPGTKIGDQSHLEGVKLSFKVELSKKYDKCILQLYSETLTRLNAAVKRNPQRFSPALAALGRTAFHFNHRKKLLTAVTTAAAVNQDKDCLASLKHILQHDSSLEASLEIVQALGFLARGKSKLSPDVIDVLLILRLDRSEEAKLHEEEGDEELLKEMQEAQIRHSSKHLKKIEVTLLTEIIVIFLRVLRTKQLHSSEVIAACLRGLANKALLVNIELLVEILEELRIVIEEALAQHDSHVSLLGIQCAFALLQGPGRALTTNMSWLGNAFTQALGLALPFIPEQENVILHPVAHSQVPQVFPKESMANQALMQESLFGLLAHLDAEIGVKVFAEAEKMLRRFGTKLSPILDIDGGLFGVGGARERHISIFWFLKSLKHHILPQMTNSVKTLEPQAGMILRRNGAAVPTKECQLLTSMNMLDLPFPSKNKKPTRVEFWKKQKLEDIDDFNMKECMIY